MVGAVLAFQLGGFLADSPLGWPSMFWLTGSLCITMAVLTTIFGAPSPQEHKSITDQERNFILGRMHTGLEKVRNLTSVSQCWCSCLGVLELNLLEFTVQVNY